jgi:hypothetical protein
VLLFRCEASLWTAHVFLYVSIFWEFFIHKEQNSAQLCSTLHNFSQTLLLYSTLLNSSQLCSTLLKSAQICSNLLNSAQLQVRKRFNGIQVWELLGYWNSVELIKQSQPLVHNHVPALTCNGMIGPVLVWFNTFSKYIVKLSYNDNTIYNQYQVH